MYRRSFLSMLAAVPVAAPAMTSAHEGPLPDRAMWYVKEVRCEAEGNWIKLASYDPKRPVSAARYIYLLQRNDGSFATYDQDLRQRQQDQFKQLGPPPVAILVEGPDWHLLGGTPDDVPGFDAAWFDYAVVTDQPYFTRAAVWAGWTKMFGRPSGTWTDTGLPCALVRKLKAEIMHSPKVI